MFLILSSPGWYCRVRKRGRRGIIPSKQLVTTCFPVAAPLGGQISLQPGNKSIHEGEATTVRGASCLSSPRSAPAVGRQSPSPSRPGCCKRGGCGSGGAPRFAGGCGRSGSRPRPADSPYPGGGEPRRRDPNHPRPAFPVGLGQRGKGAGGCRQCAGAPRLPRRVERLSPAPAQAVERCRRTRTPQWCQPPSVRSPRRTAEPFPSLPGPPLAPTRTHAQKGTHPRQGTGRPSYPRPGRDTDRAKHCKA